MAEPKLRGAGASAESSWRADAGSTDWCALRAASVAGARHRLAGAQLEDAYAWCIGPGRLAVAVADGIGSEPGSADAARRASAAAVEVAAAADPDPIVAVRYAVEAASGAAEGGGATTLVVAVVDQDGEVAAARVGDSTAFEVKGPGSWVELFEPPDPDRLGSATAALPAADFEPEVVSGAISGSNVLVLATDGVADPWRDGPTTAGPALAGAVSAHPGALELAALADFSRQGCHDDRTILCVWLRPLEDVSEAELPGVRQGVDTRPV